MLVFFLFFRRIARTYVEMDFYLGNWIAKSSMKSISRDLAFFVKDLEFSQLPKTVIDDAKLHILDSLGTTFPSASLQTTKMAAKTLYQLGGEMESTALVYGIKTSIGSATT